MKNKINHVLHLSFAWCVILIGVVFLISPIPVGVFFIAFGLSILIYKSDFAASCVRNFRVKRAGINNQLIWVEKKLESKVVFISKAMNKTRP